jgi:hypothetical protein
MHADGQQSRRPPTSNFGTTLLTITVVGLRAQWTTFQPLRLWVPTMHVLGESVEAVLDQGSAGQN